MENENKKDFLPEVPAPEKTPPEIFLPEGQPTPEELAGLDDDFLSFLPTGLEEDQKFQDALKALQAFSSPREETSTQNQIFMDAPTPAPEAEKAPIPEKSPVYVSQDTVPFTTPITPSDNNMSATQKFTPVPNNEKSTAKAPRRRGPVRKSRPVPKKGYGLFGIPHVVSTLIWLAIIVTIGISFGRILWVCATDLLAFGQPDQVVTITITEEDLADESKRADVLAQKLQKAGLIRYTTLFTFFADLTGKDDRVIPGTYELNTMYDYNALLKMMSYTPVNTEVVELLIPEGYNCAQIFKLLEDNGVCSVEKLEDWAANGELKDYWFLEGLPRGTKYCLEGYLYPDTYKFYKDADPQYVLQKFLNTFDLRFTEKMRDDFIKMQDRYAKMLKKNGYSQAWIQSHPLTFHQLITLASIVEEEKATSAEGYDIASVFYNRLTNSNYLRLDSDPTVYYALGQYFERKPLTKDDLTVDSPYNTRKYMGLPPGPITNPGSYSLYAALYPNDTSYYYFILDKKAGVHRFSKTLAEHNALANKLGY